jgi:hypothetical protein
MPAAQPIRVAWVFVFFKLAQTAPHRTAPHRTAQRFVGWAMERRFLADRG